ncbi:MAG TPA: LUD domain-containing protein [Flavisolibacter sp.]
MNSRDKILSEIRTHQPIALPMPGVEISFRFADPVAQFTTVLTAIGGSVKRIESREEADAFFTALRKEHESCINNLPAFGVINSGDVANATASEIESVHTALLRGRLGVAENGSVWLPESAMVNRLLPFLCQQLVLVITEEEIVHTMHDAYAAMRAGEEGYGVFIAGPSKTADIEQSLVLGAHGPLSLQVLLAAASLL